MDKSMLGRVLRRYRGDVMLVALASVLLNVLVFAGPPT